MQSETHVRWLDGVQLCNHGTATSVMLPIQHCQAAELLTYQLPAACRAVYAVACFVPLRRSFPPIGIAAALLASA